MNLPNIVKDVVNTNPLKSMAATVAAAGILITAATTIDSRYAHAGDIQAESLKQQRQISDLQANNLEDKVFELELKKASSPSTWQPTDQVLLDRYKRRYQDIDNIRSMQQIPKDSQ